MLPFMSDSQLPKISNFQTFPQIKSRLPMLECNWGILTSPFQERWLYLISKKNSMYLSLETHRVHIRPLEVTDSAVVFKLFQELGTDFFRNPPIIQSTEDAIEFVKQSIASMRDGHSVDWALIDKSSQRLVGIWHWGQQVPCEAYIFCCLSPEFMRQGYMTEVATTLMSRMSNFGIKKAVAEVPANNLEARFFMLHFGWMCANKGTDGYDRWEYVASP
jgi:[ribosomal protein S5]-alanine N-acetyltransferase